jgi:hypothetical protein
MGGIDRTYFLRTILEIEFVVESKREKESYELVFDEDCEKHR